MNAFLPFTRPDIDADSIAAVAAVLRSGQLASGPKVRDFEAALAAYLGGGRHLRVMTSATEGLEMALAVAGVRAGDEVIVPAMSFAASANVIARLGARPVFVDIDLLTRNIDMQLVPRALSPRTRAIMPVHFSGLPVDQEALYAFARAHGLRVVEDAAHAIGSRYRGELIGSFGDLVVFSFHPNKNMTSIEGGAIADRGSRGSRLVRAASFPRHQTHARRRDRRAVSSLEEQSVGHRRTNRHRSAQATRGVQCTAPRAGGAVFRRACGVCGTGAAGARRRGPQLAHVHGTHRFQVTRHYPADFQAAMAERGIGIGVHYPCIPGLTWYREQGYRAEEDYPVAARVGRETVTLPLFPAMQDGDVLRVCAALRAELG